MRDATLTRRQEYYETLDVICDMTGHSFRTIHKGFTFTAANVWIEDYNYYREVGYPRDMAIQYAWDHWSVNKQVSLLWV